MKIIGFDPTDAESIREAQEALEDIVLPWQKDNWSPPRWIRVTGMGVRVAIVTPWLGGYGNPSTAEHGWGYKSCPGQALGAWRDGFLDGQGQGSSCCGIAKSLKEARALIDRFLILEFPDLQLLFADALDGGPAWPGLAEEEG